VLVQRDDNGFSSFQTWRYDTASGVWFCNPANNLLNYVTQGGDGVIYFTVHKSRDAYLSLRHIGVSLVRSARQANDDQRIILDNPNTFQAHLSLEAPALAPHLRNTWPCGRFGIMRCGYDSGAIPPATSPHLLTLILSKFAK
jgi:hypothetical protein